MPWPKGKKRSIETRRRMSFAHRKRLLDPDTAASVAANLDRGREIANSEEGRRRTAERMRESMTDRVVSVETRLKASRSATGVPQSKETREKRVASLKLAHAEGRHPGWPKEMYTKPSKLEEAFARILDALGVEYERQFFAHVPGVGRHPWDFAVPSRRLLIEVDGCYWHGCDKCGYPGVPGRPEKDAAQTRAAEESGWTVIRIQGHTINAGEVDLERSIEEGRHLRRGRVAHSWASTSMTPR